MNISSISANFVRKLFADSQSRLKPNKGKTEPDQMVDIDANINTDQVDSVAAYLLPDSPMQKQLTSLLPSLGLSVNDNLKQALDLA